MFAGQAADIVWSCHLLEGSFDMVVISLFSPPRLHDPVSETSFGNVARDPYGSAASSADRLNSLKCHLRAISSPKPRSYYRHMSLMHPINRIQQLNPPAYPHQAEADSGVS